MREIRGFKLKPCPFCGEDGFTEWEKYGFNDADICGRTWVWCDCGAEGSGLYGSESEEEAVEIWNCRAAEEEPDEKRDEMATAAAALGRATAVAVRAEIDAINKLAPPAPIPCASVDCGHGPAAHCEGPRAACSFCGCAEYVPTKPQAPTKYCCNCDDCGHVWVTDEEYNRQVEDPDINWRCPQCKGKEAGIGEHRHCEKTGGAVKATAGI